MYTVILHLVFVQVFTACCVYLALVGIFGLALNIFLVILFKTDKKVKTLRTWNFEQAQKKYFRFSCLKIAS